MDELHYKYNKFQPKTEHSKIVSFKDKDLTLENSEKLSEDPKIALKNIKEQIESKNFLIKSIDSQLNNLHKSIESENENKKIGNLKFNQEIKNRNRILSKLRSQNHTLISSLSNLSDLQKTIEESASFDILQKNKNKSKLKNVKIQKDIVENKIKEIEKQIKILIDQEKITKKATSNTIIKNYDNKLRQILIYDENDNVNKKFPLSNSRNLSTLNGMDNKNNNYNNATCSIEKTEFNYMKELEKKIFAERQKHFQELRNRELEIVRSRKLKHKEKSIFSMEKYVPKKNYITYEEKEIKRKIDEESLLQNEIQKRKLRLQPISSAELDKFSNEIQRNEKIFKEELDLKKMQMLKLWSERKHLLPKSNFTSEKINTPKENVKKEQIEKYFNDKMDFAENILKNYQPKYYNNNLKISREKIINQLNGTDRYNDIKNLGKKLKKISNQLVKSQPKNFKLTNKLVNNVENETIKKTPLDKPIDYLIEQRKKVTQRNVLTPTNIMAKNVNKWQEILNNENDNIYNGIEKIKIEAGMYQNKADQKIQLLKIENYNGNYNNDEDIIKKDKMNNEISNLYINSIQAKLQILKTINENQNK